MKGHITRIKREKGFGFIKGEDGVDRFFHADGLAVSLPHGATREQIRDAVRAAFAVLPEGAKVEFNPTEEPGRATGKNQRAEYVRVI